MARMRLLQSAGKQCTVSMLQGENVVSNALE